MCQTISWQGPITSWSLRLLPGKNANKLISQNMELYGGYCQKTNCPQWSIYLLSRQKWQTAGSYSLADVLHHCKLKFFFGFYCVCWAF